VALIGGFIASALGYSPLFLATALVSLVGAGMLALWVKEPRKGRQTVEVSALPQP
jgi:predicted MFS family arabinose efflux permease